MARLSQYIPYAINTKTKRRVKAEEAYSRSEKGLYECFVPSCRKPVFLAKSKLGRMYFKHYSDNLSSHHALNSHCQSQSAHTNAIHLIKNIFLNALSKQAPMPQLIFETPHGRKTILPFLIDCTVKIEFNLDKINRRADLALVSNDGNPILLIEVNHKHPIDIKKSQDLKPFWWIEVDAKDVLNDPTNLVVRKMENFPYELELLGRQGILFN